MKNGRNYLIQNSPLYFKLGELLILTKVRILFPSKLWQKQEISIKCKSNEWRLKNSVIIHCILSPFSNLIVLFRFSCSATAPVLSSHIKGCASHQTSQGCYLTFQRPFAVSAWFHDFAISLLRSSLPRAFSIFRVLDSTRWISIVLLTPRRQKQKAAGAAVARRLDRMFLLLQYQTIMLWLRTGRCAPVLKLHWTI